MDRVRDFQVMYACSLASMACYGAAALFYVLRMKYARGALRGVASGLMVAGLAVQAWAFHYRWQMVDHMPLQTLYEIVFYIILGFVACYLVMEFAYGIWPVGALAGPFAILGLWYVNFQSAFPGKELPDALQSPIMAPHILSITSGYFCFFLAGIMSVAFLIARWREKRKSRTGTQQWSVLFDRGSYHVIALGFPFMTIGLLLGSHWGLVAWGDWWGWDPKENWALITWVFFLAYIHLRYVKGWKGTPMAVLLVTGIFVVLITLLGVNNLPTAQQSMHTYAF